MLTTKIHIVVIPNASKILVFENTFGTSGTPKDTGKKNHAVFRNRGMSGQRLSTQAPYGYLKGENGMLVEDAETALSCG